MRRRDSKSIVRPRNRAIPCFAVALASCLAVRATATETAPTADSESVPSPSFFAPEGTPAREEAKGAPAATPLETLPADVVAVIADDDEEARGLRFFGAAIDLDGDGRPELVVHVVGRGWCGTGGCTTFVFAREGDGGSHRLVARIPTTRDPIHALASTHHGWRDLLVTIGGGGVAHGERALAFDGTDYRDVVPFEAAARDGATRLVAPFESWADGHPLLPAAGAEQPPAEPQGAEKP